MAFWRAVWPTGKTRFVDSLPASNDGRHTRRMAKGTPPDRQPRSRGAVVTATLVVAAAVPIALHWWKPPQWAVITTASVSGLLSILLVGADVTKRLRLRVEDVTRVYVYMLRETRSERAEAEDRRRPVVVGILLLVLVLLGTWNALREVLDTYQTRGSLGPADAGEIIAALGGGSAIATAVAVFVVRLMRGYGTMRKESGAGAESRGKGEEARGKAQAELIRAKAEANKIRAEGEAALIKANAEADAIRSRARAEERRARAEERRADAEYLRAEGGQELPPTPDGLTCNRSCTERKRRLGNARTSSRWRP